MKIKDLENAIQQAREGESKLTPEVFGINTLGGSRTLHLINNLCSVDEKNLSYLEIGCYHGASICSALYGNKVRVVGVDNWTTFIDEKLFTAIRCEQNINKVANGNKTRLYTADYNQIKPFDLSTFGKFNIFYFDVENSLQNEENLLEYYNKNLKDKTVFIHRDWNDENIRDNIQRQIDELGYEISFQHNIYTSKEDNPLWGNGIGILLIGK